MVNIRSILCFFLLLVMLPGAAAAAQMRAVADRDRLTFGESLRLELRIEGEASGDPDLGALEKNWEILANSKSSQISIVNGDFNRSLIYSMTLTPRREGELDIPAICLGQDCSLPLPILVKPAGTSREAEDAKVLLETVIDGEKGLCQSQLLLTVRLLHRVDLLQGSLAEPEPGGVDTAIHKLGEDRQYETRRGGRRYAVVERSYALFPQTAGTLRIPPIRFDGMIAGGPSRLDPFGRQGERVRLVSKPLRVEVLPPAKDLGDRFWLPARDLRLEDDWQGKTVRLTVGEPATRTLTLTAEGLQGSQLPELQWQAPEGFKSYPDQPIRRDEPGEAGLTGILQQKVALVAGRPGRYRLPAIDLEWWDVAGGQWRTVRLDPVDVEVAPAAGIPADTLAAENPPPVAEGGPAALDPASVDSTTAQTRVSEEDSISLWPWLSLVLGLGWVTTLVLFWRGKSRKPGRQADFNDQSPENSEKSARQMVLKAARENDPRAARRALAVWSRTLGPESGRPDLDPLRRSASEALRREMERLDRSLYASNEEEWTGDALAEALRQWPTRAKNRNHDEGLPELYPVNTRKKGTFPLPQKEGAPE